MGEQANLSREEANAKIKHIAEGQVAMLHTIDAATGDTARPMATSSVDADGVIWFMTRDDSEKCRQLRADPRVKLTYSVASRSEYLALEGTGSLVKQVKTRRALDPIGEDLVP